MLKDNNGNDVEVHKVQKFGAKCVKGPSELIRHMRYALSKGLPTLAQVDAHDGEAVLCGAGPSLAENLEKIRELKAQGHMVCAIKSAHDFLIEHGIRPDMALAVDPQQKIADLYRKPGYGIRYFMATQCHPDVFDALKGYKVITWNVFTKAVHEYWMKRLKKKNKIGSLFFVNGGSTSGLRAIGLVWVMGYRKFHLFGYDSCLKTPEGDFTLEQMADADLKIGGVKNKKEIMVVDADERRFYCDPAMALQANEFLPQTEHMKDIRVKAYGNGLIPWIVERAALRNMPQCRLIDEDWYVDSPKRGSLDLLKGAA